MLVAEEFQDGWMRGLRLRDLQVNLRAWHKGAIRAVLARRDVIVLRAMYINAL